MRIARCVSVLFCVAMGSLLISPTRANAIEKIRTVEGITEYRLDNGLKVLLFPDPSKPTVTVNMTVFVGSRHEGYGEAGMAHLLEHMLFKGTPTHPAIPKALQEHGARFNGTTWLDRTNYYETLPASEKNLEFALRLEADRLINSTVKAEDLASEMTVVRNEFERGENNPQSILLQRITAAAYEWHNYGQSTIGNRADIERVPVESLRHFYRRYYQPDNAMVVVAGAFDEEQALSLIEKYFAPIPRPERELPQTYTEEPPQDGERYVTLRRVGDVAVAGVAYHIPAGPHPQFAATDVFCSILSEAPSGRLYKALVETQKAARVIGGPYALHDPGMAFFLAEATQGNDPQVLLDIMLEVIESIDKQGVTEEEVERARQQLLKQVELAANDSTQIAIQLSDWAAQGDWRLYFLYRDRLESVTKDDVEQVAASYFRRNNRTVGVFLPTKSPARVAIPETPELAEMIGDYKGRKDIAQGEAFDVAPEKIEDRVARSALPTGFKMALLPKKTRGSTVNLKLTLRYGNVENLQGLKRASEFLPAMMKRGTKSLTRQELEDQLDRHRISLTAEGEPGEATFTIQTTRENFPKALELLHQVLREPSFPENEMQTLRNSTIASLQKQLSEPTALARQAVMRQINPYPENHPLHEPTLPEEIEQTSNLPLEQVRELYTRYLSGAHGEVAVVGDFDPKATEKAIAGMLSDWKASESYARIPRKGDVEVDAKTTSINTPDKANAMYFAATVLPMRDDHPDYPALVIGNYILGGGTLTSRLGDRVRQQEGLSYGVGSGFSASALDERAVLYVYAITNPDNMSKVVNAISEEIVKLRKDGITEKELTAAKQGYLQSQQVSRANDESLVGTLQSTAQAERTMAHYKELEDEIRALSAEEVEAAVKKYIDPSRIAIVTAGDFEKSASAEEAP